MSALDELVKRHKPTCASFHDYKWVCNCGAVEAAAELAALRGQVAKKDRALRVAEWGRMTPSGDWACPVCKMLENHGHADNCELAAAIGGKA